MSDETSEATLPATPEVDTDSDADVDAPAATQAQAEGSDEAPKAEAPAESAESESPEPEAAAAPAEPEPAPEPTYVVRRQSVVMRTGSCDMRVGTGAIDQLGQAAKIAAGKPCRTLLVHGDDVDAELVERCRRLLLDAGFKASITSVAAGRASRSLVHVEELYAAMAEAHVTADDPVVVIGDADVISCAIFAGATWHTGSPVVSVPTTLDGVVDVTVTPRAIDAPGAPDMLACRGNARFAICDPSVFAAHRDTDGELMGRAVMVAGCVAAGENSFNELCVRADGIIAAEEDTLVEAILDVTKSRARVASSSALAMRQGILYGRSMGRALEQVVAEAPAPDERLLVDENPGSARLFGEALRISARLAAARQAPDDKLVDFVFTQDALLDKFGLTEVACDLKAEALAEALQADELQRSNRCMIPLPLGYGRVRFTSLEADMLAEHLGAWCKSRRKLARRRARKA